MKFITFKTIGALGLVFGLCAVGTAQSQYEVSASGRFFPGDETSDYYGLSGTYHGKSGFDYTLRGSSSKVNSYSGGPSIVRSGGKDLEAIVFWTCPQLTSVRLGLGLAAPNTPGHRKPVGTYDFSWTPGALNGLKGGVGIKGIVFGNPIGLLYGKGSYTDHQWEYLADAGIPFAGQNTFSPSSSNAVRRMVASAGARYNFDSMTWLELDYTNELGSTTGLSMTPALGGNFGLAVSIGFRF